MGNNAQSTPSPLERAGVRPLKPNPAMAKTITELKENIAKLEKAIASPATPDNMKAKFKDFVAKAKAELADLEKAPEKKAHAEPAKKAEPAAAPAKKAEPAEKKAEAKPAAKAVTPPSGGGKGGAYDCDELIVKEKEKQKKAKVAAVKRAEAPKHTPATKNRIAIEKVGERITANINKRIEKGDVKKAELEKLIAETENVLKNLRLALKKL